MTQDTKIILTPEKRDILVKDIIDYFASEKDVEIGIIAANDILDFFLKRLNKETYNQALIDCQKIIRQGMENLVVNVDSLTKL